MRASTAFFAGVGTVIMMVAAGLGGGLLIADAMNPKSAQQTTKLERRATPAPSPAPSAAPTSQPPSSAAAVTGAPATKPDASEPSPAPSPSEQVTQRDAHDKSSAPDAAFAKARDADLQAPDADSRHGAERRQSRRHQRWVERRIARQPEQGPGDDEQAWRDDGGGRNDRDDRRGRGYADDDGNARAYGDRRIYQDGNRRGDVAEPVELQLPRIRLFDGF
jgi:hypothetical protein